jgi:hypothetical protein
VLRGALVDGTTVVYGDAAILARGALLGIDVPIDVIAGPADVHAGRSA